MDDGKGQNIDSSMNAADLRACIASLCKQNTGPAKPFNKKGSEPSSDKLIDEMNKLSKSFKKSLEEIKKLTNSVRQFLNSRQSGGGGKSGGGSGGGGGGKSGGGGGKSGGGGRRSGGGGGGDPGKADRMRALVDQEKSINFYRRVQSYVGNISKTAAGAQESILGFRVFNKITDGMIVKEREFAQDVRQVAYETAGVTKASRGLQHAYEDIGKTSKITGFDRGETNKSYVKNLRKGIKDQKLALGLSTAQLNTERMIGVGAEGLGETFSDMSLSTGMNARQMAQFGRSIQDTARSTGVTGTNLAKAVGDSQQFITNLRNGARLTTTAAGNLVEMMASANKFGVSEQLGSIAGVATKGLSGLMEASSQQKALLYQAAGSMGATSELISGTLLNTKDGMKKLAGGMENILGKFGVGSMEQVANMSDQQKSILDSQLRSSYGMGLGEFMKSVEALKESSKGLDEKLGDITTKQKENLTIGEKNLLLDQKRSLTTGGALSIVAQLDEVAKSAGSMDGAFEKFGSKLPGMNKDLKALGISATDAKGASKQAIEVALKGINEGLKKAKKKELNITSSQIEKAMKDPEAFRALSSKMTDANAELGVTQKSQVDALTDVNQSLTQLNDTLRGTTMGAIGAFLDSGLAKFTAGVMGSVGGISDVLFGLTQFGVGQAEMKFGTAIAKEFGVGSSAMNMSALATSAPGAAVAAAEGGGAMATFGASAAAVAGPLAIAAVAAVALAGGILGSIAAAEHASEIFSTSQEKLTTAEYYAAKGAGAVTGALNYLTLGVFDSLLGSTGSLTIALAKFNKMIPILSAIMALIDSVLGILWGLATSIIDIFAGIGEMVYLAIAPIGDVFVAIGDAVGSILGPLFNFNSKMEETGSFFAIFANIFGVIGKAIRTVLRVIGLLVGGLVSLFVGVLAPVIRLIGTVIGAVTSVIGFALNYIYDVGLGILQFFEGVFTLNLGKIFESIGRLTFRIPQMLLSAFVFAFKILFIEIPKMMLSIFTNIPKMLYESLASLASSDWVGPIFKPFLDILKPIGTAVGELYNAFGSLFGAIGTLLDPIFYLFESIFGVSKAGESGFSAMNLLKGVIYGLSTVIGTFIRVALFPLQVLIFALVGPIKAVAWVINQITSAIGGLVSWAKGLVDAILSPFKWLYDVLVGHSIIPDLAMGIVSIFGKMALGVIGGMAKMAFSVIGGLTSLPGLASAAVGKVKGLVGDAMNLSSNLFSGFVKGFSNASQSQEGFFSSVKKGFSSMTGTDAAAGIGGFFKGIGSKLKDTFSPLTKGFSKSREQGGGVLSSIGRGVTGQIRSTSTGRGALDAVAKGKKSAIGVTAGNALGGIKGKAGGLLGAGVAAASKGKNAIGGALGGIKGKASGLLGLAGSLFSSASGGEECPCSAATAGAMGSAMESLPDLMNAPWTKGMKNLKNQNAKSLEKIAGKSGKGFLGGLKGKIDSGVKSGKGLMSGLFGKAGGVAGKAGGMLSKGTGLVSGLFGKAGGVAGKAGSLFSKSGGLMGSMFGKAGGFIAKAGLGGAGKSLLKKLPGIGAIAGAGFAISALVQGNVGGAVKELASGLAGAVPFIGPVLSAGIDFFGDGLISGAGAVASSAWEGAKSIGSSAWEGAKSIGSGALAGAKNLGSKLLDGAKTIGTGAMLLGQKYIDGWKSIGRGAWEGAKSIGNIALAGAKNLGSKLLDGAKTIGTGAVLLGQKYIDGWKSIGSSAWEGAKSIRSSAWEGAKSIGRGAWEGAKSIGSSALAGAKNLGSKLSDGAKTVGAGAMLLGQKYVDGWRTIGKGALSVGKHALDAATLPARTIAKAAVWAGGKVSGFFGGVNKSAETGAAAANKMSMPSPVYPLNKTSGTDAVSTARMSDIGFSMQREAATSDAASSSKTYELGTIAKSGHTQVEKLENMITLLQQMVGYMKPSQSSGESGQAAGQTIGNSIVGGPAKYNRWKKGQHSQGASIGVTNIGGTC